MNASSSEPAKAAPANKPTIGKPLDPNITAQAEAEQLLKQIGGGKFKNVQDALKSYQELEKRATQLAEQTKGNTPPEQYELLESLKARGVEGELPEEAQQQITQIFRENGFTQTQAAKVMELLYEASHNIAHGFIQEVDQAAEKTKLTEAWGKEAEQKYKAARNWAAANLHPDALNKPLWATAAGAQLIADLMQVRSGAQPISHRDTVGAPDTSAEDNVKLRDRIRELMDRKDANTPDVQKMLDALIKQTPEYKARVKQQGQLYK